MDEMRAQLSWPRCAYVPTIARRGEGLVEALDALLAMIEAPAR